MSLIDSIKKNNVTIITAVLSILATIIVGWITIDIGANQTRKAEYERELKVKEKVIKLVEQNIITGTPLNPQRLNRLISAQCIEEGITNEISAVELIKRAELNLLSSNHLASKQKDEYKVIFDSIYNSTVNEVLFAQLDSNSVINMDLLNNLTDNIKNCKIENAENDLSSLVAEYEQELQKEKLRTSVLGNRSKSSFDTYRRYISLFQIVVVFGFYIGFSIYRDKLFPEMEYKTVRKIRRALFVLVIAVIIPEYFDLFNSIIVR